MFGAMAILTSCGDKTGKKRFEVSGTIINNPAKMIYLEEIPMSTMQRIVVDSAVPDPKGVYVLETTAKEASVYNLRLDQNTYPLTSVINDAVAITVNATFSKVNSQFAESYEVKGSPASQQMKDFLVGFNGKLQAIYFNARQADSLQQAHGADSTVRTMESAAIRIAGEARSLALQSFKAANNPALLMFELGYYQSTANNPAFRIEPLANEEVSQIVNDIASRFPGHTGVRAIKNSLDAQLQKASGFVGKQAPEIVLPDVDGKEVRLSSFRGKYVLVDFWASWCKPCRLENPNIVKAFNKYRDKNFTVLGVSLDRQGARDEWLEAIRKDNLDWTQVSDLMYWNSLVVPLYNIDGIPFNVLVDPDGKVIAQGLQGGQLEAKLSEILK